MAFFPPPRGDARTPRAGDQTDLRPGGNRRPRTGGTREITAAVRAEADGRLHLETLTGRPSRARCWSRSPPSGSVTPTGRPRGMVRSRCPPCSATRAPARSSRSARGHQGRPGDKVALTFTSAVSAQLHAGLAGLLLPVPALNYAGARPRSARSPGGRPGALGLLRQSASPRTRWPRAQTWSISEDAPLALVGPLGCGIQTGGGAVMNSIRAPRFLAAGDGRRVGGPGRCAGGVVQGCETIIVSERTRAARTWPELGATHALDRRT